MTAVRELALLEIERRLRAIAGVAEVERMPEGDPDAFPALHVFDLGQRPTDDQETGLTRYGMGIVIDGFVDDAGDRAATSAALNELYATTVTALVTDPPLDGLAETIEEGAMQIHQAPLAAERGLGFSLDFTITFPTRRGQPAQTA